MTRFKTLSLNRLDHPRRVSTPKDGFLGTIQKHIGGWYAEDKNGVLLGSYPTKRDAVSALEQRT